MSNADSSDKAAIQRRIDRYLKEVDEVLKAGDASWKDRNNILDNIQTQIRDMLAERAPAGPSVADIEAIILGLDDPKSYTPTTPDGAPKTANPLRPLYLALSYIFLLLSIAPAMGIVIPVSHVLLARKQGMALAILPLILCAIFFVIVLSIAQYFRKAANK